MVHDLNLPPTTSKQQTPEESERVDVLFLPQKKAVKTETGRTLLDIARGAFIDIESACNAKVTCGKCKIEMVDGSLSELHDDERKHLSEDEIQAGVRLACHCKVEGSATVRVLGASRRRHRILADGLVPKVEFDPHITKGYLELEPPTLEDNRPDIERIASALGVAKVDLSISSLRLLPSVVREAGWKVTLVVAGDRLIGVEPGDTTATVYGAAVDIGTTTVVVSLIDLVSGKEIGAASAINPQKDYGLDVLSRIQLVKERSDGLNLLGNLIRKEINRLIGELSERHDIPRRHIYEVAVAGNTTMLHLFAGVDPRTLGSSPYAPVFTGAVDIPAGELGIDISPDGSVFCLPSVSSYVGADIVAGLIATGLGGSDERSLLIDIGTNGEIVFGSKDGLYACSCAAGPAFEGMNIGCGMRAADGAIEKVHIDDEVVIATIGEKPAVGICGSGVIDAIAELVKVQAVQSSGRFAKPDIDGAPPGWLSSLVRDNGASRFILSGAEGKHNEVAITQKDIRQVQLAKGAILSGIIALTSQPNLELSEIDRIYIAGAFGHHVRLESLARLGVFPSECLDKVVLIGNSSKTGGLLSLLSREKRREASEVAKRVNYIELSCYPEYDRLFANCLTFQRQ